MNPSINILTITVLTVLSICAITAAAFGYITPDSWKYLTLAQALRDGEGCSIGGNYFAVFPCGYPSFIAFTAPGSDLASLLIGSKLTNLLLLSSSFWLLIRSFSNHWIAIVIILNPITIAIFYHTWSENLLLFAIAGSIYSFTQFIKDMNQQRYIVLLALFLVIGCSARYFFGPFAFIMFISIWLAYGKTVALRVLPAFIITGLMFLGFQGFNIEMTGFATGQDRIIAPESFTYLLVFFLSSLLRDIILLLVFLLLIFRSLRKNKSIAIASNNLTDNDVRPYHLVGYMGLGFLLLSFFLRVFAHYNMYSYRTVGYGEVLLMAAMIGLYLRSNQSKISVKLIIMIGLFSTIVGQGSGFIKHLKSVTDGSYTSPLTKIQNYQQSTPNTDLLISFRVPSITKKISGHTGLYYGQEIKVFSLLLPPYDKPESVESFKKKVASHQAKRCLIDFTQFNTHENFLEFIQDTYPVDLDFNRDGIKNWVVKKPKMTPAFKIYLLEKFKPGQYEKC